MLRNRFHHRLAWLCVAAAAAVSPLLLKAEEALPRSVAAATQPATQPATDSRSADQVKKDLETRLQGSPIIEPTRRARDTRAGEGTPPPAKVNLDPAVIGSAPGSSAAKLSHEGDFIVNRVARLVRSSSGAQVTIVFEAENKTAPETPLIVLPNQSLENLEDVIQERGDNTPFVASGEVTTYRGSNYILLTMWTLTHDKGNLQK